MFILRSIDPLVGFESNKVIGEFYSVIRENNQTEAFNKHFHQYFGAPYSKEFGEGHYTESCYAFLQVDGGELEPLFEPNSYYIMTSEGKTFSNLSRNKPRPFNIKEVMNNK